MNLLAAKIYYDGSNWIAIPHTKRPYRRRRRKPPEKSAELQQFEERFETVKGGRKSRKAKLLQEFTPMFKDEDEAEQFVEEHFNRLSRNRWERYKRMIRRGYTNRWNFFCAYTVTCFYGHSSKSGISKRIFITYTCHVPKSVHKMSYNVLENQKREVCYECIRQSYRL